VDELGTGSQSRVTSVLAFALAGYALYWAVAYVETHSYRISFLLLVLLITFLTRQAEPFAASPAEAAGEGGRTLRCAETPA